jgi:hypothetical protein
VTDLVQVALIAASPGWLAALIAIYNAFVARNTAINMAMLEKNTNSIKDALIVSTQNKAFAEGQLDQKQRTGEITAAVDASKQKIPDVISRQEKDT